MSNVNSQALAEGITEVLKKHLGAEPLAVAVVWYSEQDGQVNLMQNTDDKNTIAILADAIKIAARLPRPS